MNTLTLQGFRKNGDEELKTLTNGTVLLNTVLVIASNYEKDGERVEVETDIPVTLWGKMGEGFHENVAQGQMVNVYGQLTNRKRQGKQGGEFDNVQVKADRWELVGDVKPVDVPQARPNVVPRKGAEDVADDLPF
jgi:single-stranded DNA-binding protein